MKTPAVIVFPVYCKKSTSNSLQLWWSFLSSVVLILEVYNNELKSVLASCNLDDVDNDDDDENDDDGDDDDDDDENSVDVKSVLTACDRPLLIRATSYCDLSG